jgi:hypothetical protein
MKKNLGSIDKSIRLAITAVIVVLYFMGIIPNGTLGIVLLLLAGVLVLTSLVSFCPLYAVFSLASCKPNEAFEKK